MFVKEFDVPTFAKFYPDYTEILKHLGLDLTDPEYVIRVRYKSDGTVDQYEIGYVNDKWFLQI